MLTAEKNNDSPASDRQSDEISNLLKKYKLTDKEAMIIRMMESGCLRESLPEKLFISETTFKDRIFEP